MSSSRDQIKQQLLSYTEPDISFNYLGQWDNSTQQGSLFKFAKESVGAFEVALHEFMRASYAPLIKQLDDTGALDADIQASLQKALEEFKKTGNW